MVGNAVTRMGNGIFMEKFKIISFFKGKKGTKSGTLLNLFLHRGDFSPHQMHTGNTVNCLSGRNEVGYLIYTQDRAT